MAQKVQLQKRRRSESTQAKTQQKNRLKRIIFKKAAQYSLECESDVYVMIRTRRNGQRFIFNSSVSERWLPSMPELNEYYPTPIIESLEDVVSKYDDKTQLDPKENDSTYGSSGEKDAEAVHGGLGVKTKTPRYRVIASSG